MLLGGSLGTYHRQHALRFWGMAAWRYDLPASQQAAQQHAAYLARLGQPGLFHQTVRNVDAPACMDSTQLLPVFEVGMAECFYLAEQSASSSQVTIRWLVCTHLLSWQQ